VGTNAAYIPVREETPAVVTVKLLFGMFGNEKRGVELFKNILSHFGLNRRRCTAEFVKIYMEPAVNSGVYGVIPVAQFAGAYPLFGGAVFRGCAVFIGPAYIEGFITLEPAKTRESVGGKHLNQIAQMGYVIYIRKRGSN
jgi:hypothetical protein